MTQTLRPKLDVWGRDIVKEGGLGPDIMSPVYTATRDNDPVTAEALALGLRLGDPSRTVGGSRLSDGDFHLYRQMAGQLTYTGMANAMSRAEWQGLSKEQRFKAATEIKNDARKQARGILFGGVGEKSLPGALALPTVQGRAPPSAPPLPPQGGVFRRFLDGFRY